VNNIFLSYRRGDSGPTSGRMFDSLEAYFGKDAVFKDVDSIPFGASFPEYIASVLATCGVTLVVIGPHWATIADADGRRRLDAPEDFVRIEVETALKSGQPVIPVQVDGAAMPAVDQLPASILPLRRLNAIQVRPDPDYHTDMARLIKVVEQNLLSRSSTPTAAEVPVKYQPEDVYRNTGRFLLTCAGVLMLLVGLLALAVFLILR